MLQAQFFLNRPLGGGRPVPPTRSQRRKTHLWTLLGIEICPGNTKSGTGVEVQLRARHSYSSFLKAWLVSLVSIRGRCWPVGVLFLYLVYLFGIVALLKLKDGEHLEEDSMMDNVQMPINELGVALFFLLGFRTNNSYEHWWKARMQWSLIQGRSLNMLREAFSYVDDLEMRNNFLRWNIALLYTIKAHLREERDVSGLHNEHILTEQELDILVAEPDMVAHCLVKLSEFVYTTMNKKLTQQPQLILQLGRDNLKQLAQDFSLADGIRVTPLPYAYVVHLRFFLVVWLLALPLPYTVYFGWYAVPAAFVIGVALLGFDSIASKIENPYGSGFNDIPMEAIVERSTDVILHHLRQGATKKHEATKTTP